jgi:hypothetical protein
MEVKRCLLLFFPSYLVNCIANIGILLLVNPRNTANNGAGGFEAVQ